MHSAISERERAFPLGATVSLDQLDQDPHPVLAHLRAREPVSWLPALDGWLVTRHDDAVAVMRDPDRFTVADPRFSTGQVLGPSMLSLDGAEHARHRAPFVAPFRARAVRQTFAHEAAQEAGHLVDRLVQEGAGELRRGFAGPLAAAIVGRALGLQRGEEGAVLGWYDAIVGAVTAITAGRAVTADGRAAFQQLRGYLLQAIEHGPAGSLLAGVAAHAGLAHEEIVSNAAVLLFGGVETTEGMISNALLHLLERPELLDAVRTDERLLAAALEESLRFEPAASPRSGAPRSWRVNWFASRSQPPTATPSSLPAPTSSTSTAQTPAAIWPSRRALTFVSASTSRDWKRGRGWGCC
jgi:cytochrome P450